MHFYIYTFKNICPKCHTYKKHCITRNSNKGAGKVFLVKIKNKMLLPALKILGLLKGRGEFKIPMQTKKTNCWYM